MPTEAIFVYLKHFVSLSFLICEQIFRKAKKIYDNTIGIGYNFPDGIIWFNAIFC